MERSRRQQTDFIPARVRIPGLPDLFDLQGACGQCPQEIGLVAVCSSHADQSERSSTTICRSWIGATSGLGSVVSSVKASPPAAMGRHRPAKQNQSSPTFVNFHFVFGDFVPVNSKKCDAGTRHRPTGNRRPRSELAAPCRLHSTADPPRWFSPVRTRRQRVWRFFHRKAGIPAQTSRLQPGAQ